MMRGLRPLFALAVCAFAAQAYATEMIEIPTPPPPPPAPPASAFVSSQGANDPQLLLAVDAGPTFRSAFGTSFAGAAAEIMIGGDSRTVSFAGRLHLEVGQTFGLPYEDIGGGMFVMGRLSPRVRLGAGFLFGVFMYQRASASSFTDPTVWAPSLGVDGEVTVDLLRTRRGGALFARARVGYDYIDPLGSASGSSAMLAASLGYRY